MKTKLTTALAIALVVAIPIQSKTQEAPPPDNPKWLIPLCIVAATGAAIGSIYIVSKKCQPKYYWMMDNDSPPNFFVGNATRKECQINDWKRIGGPYNGPADAPPQHPSPTNRVDNIVGPMVKIQVHQSNDLQNWTVVHSEVCDTEDFGYFPTNTTKGAWFYRLEESAP